MKPLDGFHHAALTVSDLKRSAEWYAQVLGMVELFREDSPSRRAAIYGFADGIRRWDWSSTPGRAMATSIRPS